MSVGQWLHTWHIRFYICGFGVEFIIVYERAKRIEWSDVVKYHVVGSCFSCRTLISLRVLSLTTSLGQGCRSYYPEHAPSCSVQVGVRSCWDPLLESTEGLRFCLVASDCLKLFYLWPLECFISACDRAVWYAIKSIPFLEYSARVHWWHWSY